MSKTTINTATLLKMNQKTNNTDKKFDSMIKNFHIIFLRAHQIIKLYNFLDKYRIFLPTQKFPYNFTFDVKSFYHFIGLHHLIKPPADLNLKEQFQNWMFTKLKCQLTKFIEEFFNVIKEKPNIDFWDGHYEIIKKVNKKNDKIKKIKNRGKEAINLVCQFFELVVKNTESIKNWPISKKTGSFMPENGKFFLDRICKIGENSFLRKYFTNLKKQELADKKLFYVACSFNFSKKSYILLMRGQDNTKLNPLYWIWVNFISVKELREIDKNEWIGESTALDGNICLYIK